ncbi:MAG: hypothetical protein WCA78_06315 [Rhizomicrobium sp.]
MQTFLKTLAFGWACVLTMLIVEIIVTGRMPNLSIWDEATLYGAIFGAAFVLVLIIAALTAVRARFSRGHK